MKKLVSLLLLCCMLTGVLYVPTAAEQITVEEVTENFEMNSATAAAEGFISSICTVPVKENAYTSAQSDFRSVSGKYSLEIEKQNAEAIEINGIFSSVKNLSDAEMLEVSLYLSAEQLSTGEKNIKIPVTAEISEKTGEAEKSVYTYSCEITSDNDFNSDNEGFEKVTFAFESENLSDLGAAVLRINLGDEDGYPTVVYVDDITVKLIKQKEEEAKAVYEEPAIIGLMRALGISNKLTDEYIPSNEMTRADFADIVAGFLNIESSGGKIKFEDVYEAHYAYDSIKLVNEFGIMNGTGENLFEPDVPITYIEAVAALVKFLGYEEFAKVGGGYPVGYYTIGKQQNIVAGNKAMNEVLTQQALAEVLERFVKAEVLLTASIWVDNPYYSVTYRTDESVTVLKEFFDIDFGRGIVEADDASSIEGAAVSSESVIIDGVKFRNKDSAINANELLGYNVDYYYKDTTLVFAAKNDRNKEIFIDADDYNGMVGSQLSYYVGETVRQTDIFNCTLIFNGVQKELSKDLFDSFYDGEIIILDNNRDGKYEIIFVNSYEYYIVKNVDAVNEIISDKYSRASINLKDYEKVILNNSDKTPAALTSISENDVLRVKRPDLNDKSFLELVVYKNRVSGNVSEIKGNSGMRQIKVDGRWYEVSETAENFIADKFIPDFTVNTNATLLLNDGEVVSWIVGMNNSLMVGYIVNGGTEDKGVTKTRKFRILTEYGVLEVFDVNDKIKLDGTASVDAFSTAFENKFFSNGEAIQQLVRFKLNSKGLISVIETAEEYVSGATVLEKDKLIKISDSLPGSAYINYKNSGIAYFVNGTDGAGGVDVAADNKLYSISPTAKAFVLPEKGGRYEEDMDMYTVSSGFNITGVGGANPKAYIVNGMYNVIDYFVTQNDNPGGDYIYNFKGEVAIVTNVEYAMDSDGDYGLKIECYRSNSKSEFWGDFHYQPEDENDPLYFDYNRISPGDLIIYAEDANGEVDLYDREKRFYYLMDFDEETNSLSTVYSDLQADKNGYEGRIAGQRGGWFNALMYVYDIRDGYAFLNYKENISSAECNRALDYSKFKTYVFDGERGLFYEGDLTEATTYVNDSRNVSPVYVMLREGVPISMIVYK